MKSKFTLTLRFIERVLFTLFLSTFIYASGQSDFNSTPWSPILIGNVQQENFMLENSMMVDGMSQDEISIGASGMGIMGSADNFHFAFKSSDCNATITAKLEAFNFTDSSPNARGGIMIRQGFGMDMPYVALLKTTSGQLSFQFRTAKGMAMSGQMVDRTMMPIYIRLSRTQNLFEAFTSMDGMNWMSAGSMMIEMTDAVNYGLAISSANQMMMASTEFSEVSLACAQPSTPPCMMPPNRSTSEIAMNQAKINWDMMASADRYEFRYRRMGMTAWTEGSTMNGAMQLSNLMMNTQYEWQVRSVCTSGETSAYSPSMLFSTMQPCMMPPNRSTSNISMNQARINWDMMGAAERYDFRYRPMGMSTWTEGSTMNGGMQLSDLMMNTQYEWQVRSVCTSGGTSAYSPSMIFSTMQSCMMPPNRSTTNIGMNQARINWDMMGAAERYDFRYRPMGMSTWTEGSTMNGGMQLSDLMMNTEYEWQVRSVCGAGMMSPYSAAMMFTTMAMGGGNATTCMMPPNRSTSNITMNQARINWDIMASANKYEFRYRRLGTLNWLEGETPNNAMMLTDLFMDTMYEWQVRSVCGVDERSPFSPSMQFRSMSGCIMPPSRSTSNVTMNQARINWGAMPSAESFEFRYKPTGSSMWVEGATANNGMMLSGLMMNTVYEWQVRSVCGPGMVSAYSPSTEFSTMLSGGVMPSCMMPPNRSTSNIGYDKAYLDWESMGGAMSYDYRYRRRGDTTWDTKNTTASRVQIRSLNSEREYEWQVRSVCANGMYSPYSPLMTFTTTAGCMRPSGLYTSMLTNTSARINWEPSDDASTYIFEYRLKSSDKWIQGTTSNTFMMLNDLLMNSVYEWKVRTQCSTGGVMSPFAATKEFTTDKGMIPSGTSLYYRFNDQSGSRAQDMVGDNTGSLQDFQLMPWMPMDGNGGTLSFDGKNDHVAITNLSYERDSIMEASVALWIKTVSGESQAIVSFDKRDYYALEIDGWASGAGQLNWAVRTDKGMIDLASPTRIDDGQWHFVAAVFNRGEASIYIDGELDVQVQKGQFMGTGMERFGFLGVRSSAQEVNGSKKWPRGYFEGSLDEVRIYDEALTGMRIMNMYQAELPLMRDIPIRTGFYVEGECGVIGQNWLTENMPSGMGQYVTIMPGISSTDVTPNMMSDRIEYSFEVDMPGMYNIFMRAQLPNEGANSFWIQVNEGEWFRFNSPTLDPMFKWHLVGSNFVSGTTNKSADPRIMFRLEQGMNTIKIAYREDGARLDKMFISMGPWTPLDAGPSVPCSNPSSTTETSPSDFFLEAECGNVGDNWDILNMPNGMGQFVKINSDFSLTSSVSPDYNDRIRYSFIVEEAGMYNMFLRARAKSGGDSFWLNVNDSGWIAFNDITEADFFLWDQVHQSNNNNFKQSSPISFQLEEGVNTLSIVYREIGTELDKIFFTKGESEPTTAGPVVTCRPPAPTTDTYMATDIFAEVECGIVGQNWEIIDMPNGMGQYATVKNGANSKDIAPNLVGDRIRLSINALTAGMYNIFTRVLTLDNGGNSFWIRVNEGNWVKFNQIDRAQSFIWDQVHNTDNMSTPLRFRLEEGMNTLDIAFRESGTQIDKVFLTMGEAMPADAGPITSCPPTAMAVSYMPSDIFLEAECGMIGNKFETLTMPNGMGQFIQVKEGFNSKNTPRTGMQDRVRFSVNATTAGMYNVFVRSKGKSGSNSFWVRVNEGQWIEFDGILSSTFFLWDQLHNSENLDSNNYPMPVRFRLEQGMNTIDFAYREEQTVLDKIFLTMGMNEPLDEGPMLACNFSNGSMTDISQAELDAPIENGLNMYPNPANTNVSIEISSQNESTGQITFYDLTGKVVNNQIVEINEGISRINLPISQLNAGVYLVTYKDDYVDLTQRLVVIH